MSNGEHEIRTPKGLRIGNRSVVDGKNMLQIKRGGCEDYISAESLKAQRWNLRRHLVSRPAPPDVLLGLQYNICLLERYRSNM